MSFNRETFLKMFEAARKPDKIDILYNFRKDLPKDELSLLMGYWWVLTEFPNQYPNKMIRELFSSTDKKLLMSKESYKVYSSLPDEIKVYRGVQGLSKKTKIKGFSWTLDKKTAEWFAERFCSIGVKKGNVYAATIKKEDIYFYTNGRGEQEVVLNPNKLMGVTV